MKEIRMKCDKCGKIDVYEDHKNFMLGYPDNLFCRCGGIRERIFEFTEEE